MNIIIPIGGVGQGFKDDNYITPKPLINVLVDPMICRLISGLNTGEKINPFALFFGEQIRSIYKNNKKPSRILTL